ncbi:MAG: hypothetical protein GY788_18145 [bacterium]|nr:hypothetical protein [bacterium]
MIGHVFVGADPAGLFGLADSADQYASRIDAANAAVLSVENQRGQGVVAVGPRLSRVEGWLSEQARELRWRAAAIDEAQRVGTPHFFGPSRELMRKADFAAHAVFDLDTWEAVYLSQRAAPHPAQLLKMSPREIAETFADLAPATAQGLAARYPRLIGGLDGVPPELRYLANAMLLEAEIARLETGLLLLADPQSPRDLRALGIGASGRDPVSAGLVGALSAALSERAAEYRRWLAEDRQILLFNPAGDGRVVEVFGDLSAATQVGVVVPGMANSIENFGGPDGGFRANAVELMGATSGLGNVATVAWLGYDSPDTVGAVTRSAASSGAPALIRFLEGLSPNQTITVVAHSYGSVVAGTAARTGIAADNLVFVGSPGTTLDHADDAVLRPGGRVWSGLADGDPIAWGVAPQELPIWLLLSNPLLTASGLWHLFDGPSDLWHGPNPASEEFGATRIDTEGSSGHSSYFEANSLENLAAIVEGNYAAVELAP